MSSIPSEREPRGLCETLMTTKSGRCVLATLAISAALVIIASLALTGLYYTNCLTTLGEALTDVGSWATLGAGILGFILSSIALKKIDNSIEGIVSDEYEQSYENRPTVVNDQLPPSQADLLE